MSGRRSSSSATTDDAARRLRSDAPRAWASGASTGSNEVGRRRAAPTTAWNVGQLRLRRQVADDQEVPHRFERSGAGEVRGVVAAVVEATGLAIDVADGRVGDGDAVEAGGYVDQGAHDFMLRAELDL